MSKIKLPHASGNSMSIAAPATNPSGDLELKLPATIGSAGQVLKNSDTAGTLEFGPLLKSGRNVLINSNFAINQRGSFTANQGEYTIDRWYHNTSGATSTITQETHTVGSEIEGQEKYLKQSVSTGNNYCCIRYRHEDVKTITPGTWTVSFWAKGTTPPGGLQFWCDQDFGTGGSADVNIAQQTITALTGSWVRQSFNITVPSFSGKTINAASYFQFAIGQGSDGGTAAWEMNIANVQLEKGSQMTDYEPPRSYHDELLRCQRYYYNHVTDTGTQLAIANIVAYNSSTGYGTLYFPTTMRAHPSIDATSGGNYYIMHGDGGSTYSNSVNQETVGTNAVLIQVSGSYTSGGAYFARTTANSAGKVSFSAEL